MTEDLNLTELLANPPKLHVRSGELISNWGIDDTTCIELNRRLKRGMLTLETGAGLSTVIFAAHGCQHTCVMPDKSLADRIQEYCKSAGIQANNVRFVVAKSSKALPQIAESSHDLILIDGCHGLPSVFVDFYYAAKALKLGGTLIVDDMHIYSCRLVARYMQVDPGWKMDIFNDRVAFGIKIADTADYDWGHRFVTQRSHSVMRHPVRMAKVAGRHILQHGLTATFRKTLKAIYDRRPV